MTTQATDHDNSTLAARPTAPLYRTLARLVQAIENCKASGNEEWRLKHTDTILELCAEHMPSGSGWDRGTKFDFDRSTPEKLVFYGSFHHMDEWGGYDGWTDHTITVRPSLSSGFTLSISGRNRNDIKEVLYQDFEMCLSMEVSY